MPTMRAFIAVPIGNDLGAALAAAQSGLKESAADARWVAPRNIHLTLVFLGDIAESAVEPLAIALDELALLSRPCTLEVRGLGFFGRPSSPRVIWAGLRGDLDNVAHMQKRSLAAANAAGCRPDAKPFSPHLTIGRVKSARNTRALLDAIEAKKDACFGELAVQNIVLFKSLLNRAGPEYFPLHVSVLAGGKDREDADDP